MPNPYKNQVFGADDAGDEKDDFSALGFHEEEELEPESDGGADGGEENEEGDFDLKGEDDGVKIFGPIFKGTEAEEDEGEDLAAAEEDGEDEEEAAEENLISDDSSESEEEGEDGGKEADEEYYGDGGGAAVSKKKIILARKFLNNIRENAERLSSLLGGLLDEGDEERIGLTELSESFSGEDEAGGRIVEGVFNGENMIGPDGHEYAVPANYASKSKLVEGDMLKLTITDNGVFRYKQTKPIERKRIIGKLEKDANGNYLVNAEHKKFRVITASITYYKGVSGDKVVILVPVASDSAWAAVENVIKSK
jgi:hypothetical protein